MSGKVDIDIIYREGQNHISLWFEASFSNAEHKVWSLKVTCPWKIFEPEVQLLI